ncbi:MAG: DUF3833 family protein [Aestuariivita sp.]|nr:DUF3833 family protein [Aestuariivita sp.]
MEAILFILLGVILACSMSFVRHRWASFMSQVPRDYANREPHFDVRTHLNGPIKCEGIIYGPLGRVTTSFVADFFVTWNDNVGVMKEHFCYDDGSVQDREWQLTINNDGSVQAKAADVIGAGIGKPVGSALRLKYRIKLASTSGEHVLNAIDWMYVLPNNTIVNRSQFRKFGIKVGELVATMRPIETEPGAIV